LALHLASARTAPDCHAFTATRQPVLVSADANIEMFIACFIRCNGAQNSHFTA